MKLSFWQWVGTALLVLIVGAVIFRLIYGNKLIEQNDKIIDKL